MTEQIDIYYKPLNKFNLSGRYFNVYLNKNNNLYMPFLNNTIPINKINISLESDYVNKIKELYDNMVNNINYLRRINNDLTEYINNQQNIINKINIGNGNNG